MIIEDYLELYESFVRTQIENNPTDFTENSLKEVIIDAVHQLKPYRLDDHMTSKTLSNILRKYQRAVRTPDGEIDHYDEYSVDSIVLSHILLKYLKKEVSFHYAYVLLQQSVNRRTAFAEDLLYRNEQAIEDAVLADIQNERKALIQKETFLDLLIHDNKDVLVKQLHKLLDYKKGKDVATVIKALERRHLLQPYSSISSLHALITTEFGNIGGLRNFSNYMQGLAGYQLKDSDIEEYTNIII